MNLSSSIFVFFFTLPFYTLFNPTGLAPLYLFAIILVASSLVCQMSSVKFKRVTVKLNFVDFFLFLFLLWSCLSVILNVSIYNLNLNHFAAELFVISFFYFILRVAIANSYLKSSPSDLFDIICISAIILFVSGFIDYVLLVQGINIADVLALEKANKVAGVGYSSRPRGFSVEPSDFGLALNALLPIAIFYLGVIRKFLWCACFIVLYLLLFYLVRSASAFFSLAVGLLLALGVALCDKYVSKKVLLAIVIQIFFFSVACGILVISFNPDYFQSILLKLTFSAESGSAVARLEAYSTAFHLIGDDIQSLVLGRGTGFVSGHIEKSTISWYLSLIIEKGVIGILLVLTTMFLAFLYLIRRRGVIKYGLIISLCSILVHLGSQTGFYFPFLWIALALVFVPWPVAEKKCQKRIRVAGS
jgi:hypothetical protein